jgi:hypothetical protein
MCSEHCDLADFLVDALCDVVRLDLVDLVVWAIVVLACGDQCLSEQAEQGSFGGFADVHVVSELLGYDGEKVKVVRCNRLKFETSDWFAMHFDHGSNIALFIEHLTEWGCDDCDSVDWV